MWLLALTLPSYAGDVDPEKVLPDDVLDGVPVRYDPKQVVDFDAVDVKGAIVGPGITLTTARTPRSYPPSMWVRKDWDDVMPRSVDDVK
ncbi:MAG: hypothetical protein H6738_08715 [Alphaproteobacteria bacterium]|nr:hypothetical protein [Alphaproteobacteria bacterium]MCB9696842.1 hypothetical protein [Alphaproteobacteria bacterium]